MGNLFSQGVDLGCNEIKQTSETGKYGEKKKKRNNGKVSSQLKTYERI